MPNQFTNKSPRSIIDVIGPSIAYVALGNDAYSLIDRHSVEKVARFNWYLVVRHDRNDSRYAARATSRANGQKRQVVKLQREIMGSPGVGLLWDHANLNGLDNREANLRRATNAQNQLNTRARSKNRLGLKGVRFRGGKYIANFCGKYLGVFDSAESAAKAYRQEASSVSGEFFPRVNQPYLLPRRVTGT